MSTAGQVRRLGGHVKFLLLAAAVAGPALMWFSRPEPIETRPVTVAQETRGARIWYSSTHYPKLQLPDGQAREVRSLLNITRRMRFGDYVWNEDHVPAGPVWVRIDLARQTLSVFRADHEIGSAVILYGTDGKPTPVGTFSVLAKAKDHQSSLYDAAMPFMLRLTNDGVAIHASNVRQGFATHGCIGIPAGFARLLFDQIRIGDPVAIVPAAPTPSGVTQKQG